MFECIDVMFVVVILVILVEKFVGYYYDIFGWVFENIEVFLVWGLCVFDVVVGGFGGCFYVSGVVGNVVIEVVYEWFIVFGYIMGLDVVLLIKVVIMV